jgi:DNA-binding transcriptional MocR family regulator
MLDIVSIQIEKNNGPLYQSLADAIEKQLFQSGVNSGERLPPVREIAEKLGVNNSTVVAAYRHLDEKGLVYTKPGSGTYCLPQTVPMPQEDELDHLFRDYAELSSGKLALSEDMINLAGNSPTADAFPVAEFKSAVDEVLDSDGGYAFSYQESEGYYPLREILSSFSQEQYGIKCRPDDILITSGAQQALDLISKAMVHPGDTVLAEMPSYVGVRSVFTMHDAKILSVPIEGDGINLDIVEFYAKQYKPRLLYTMPVYQTPTGVSMSAEKRQKLLFLAEKYDFYIIEDDLFSDLTLKGERMFPIKTEDKAGRVIYVKSFSKLLMPGVRTGYVIVPQKLFEKLSAAKYATDISGSGFIQRALAVYFKNGCWGKNIVGLSNVYRERLKIALQIVSEWKKFGVRASDVKGGFGLWLTLPDCVVDREIYYLCKERKVLVAPGSFFYLSPMAGFEQHLRISFASTDQLDKGLHITGECIKSAVNRNSKHTIFI